MRDSDILFKTFMRLGKFGNTIPLPQNFQLWTNLISVLINLSIPKFSKCVEAQMNHNRYLYERVVVS